MAAPDTKRASALPCRPARLWRSGHPPAEQGQATGPDRCPDHEDAPLRGGRGGPAQGRGVARTARDRRAQTGRPCGEEGGQRGGGRPWAAGDRGEGRGARGGRAPGQKSTVLGTDRLGSGAQTCLHFAGRTEGGAVGLGIRTALAKAPEGGLGKGKDRFQKQLDEPLPSPTPDTGPRSPRCNRIKYTQTTHSQKHNTKPEMDQKEKVKKVTVTSGKKWEKTTKSSQKR